MCLRVGHLKNYININKLVTTKASAYTYNTNTKSFAGILSPTTHGMKRIKKMKMPVMEQKRTESRIERFRHRGKQAHMITSYMFNG